MLIHPADKELINQWYGDNPLDYAKYGLDGHEGLDYAIYDKFMCIGDGVVTSTQQQHEGSGNYGMHIRVKHEIGDKIFESIYAHCSYIFVKPGQVVKQGELIGHSGNTGNSSGIHLHLTLKLNGVIVDPMEYLEKDLGEVAAPIPELPEYNDVVVDHWPYRAPEEEAKIIPVYVYDISAWNHARPIDYDLFAEEARKRGVVGVIIKWKEGMEGNGSHNPHALEDYTELKKRGFMCGFYNWLHPNHPVQMQVEYWSDMPYKENDFPPSIDVEMRHLIKEGIISAEDYEQSVIFATQIMWGEVMIYTNYEEIRDWCTDKSLFDNPMWMALWESGNRDDTYTWTPETVERWIPPIMKGAEVALHQYSGYSYNSGMEGKIDISITSLYKFYQLTNQLHLLRKPNIPEVIERIKRRLRRWRFRRGLTRTKRSKL